MRDLLIQLGTLLEVCVLGGIAAYTSGVVLCAVVCGVGGYCMALHDAQYVRRQEVS